VELVEVLVAWSEVAVVLGVVAADWSVLVTAVAGAAAWFDSTAVVLELAAVLWLEFMSVEGVVVVAGAAAAGAALLSTFVALVCEVTGGVALLAVIAALLPGFAALLFDVATD
jgi:hypothetical protein